ncbi:MAG: hypothetical protein KDN18_16710 [Verrucomicrobiae bacterium]|nr:hypothetical protein [Verrucomicrobiae bacterium]
MRLPEFAGCHYEGLLSEDAFGWTFVALHDGGKRRLVRAYKAQATNDRLLKSYLAAFSASRVQIPGFARIHDYALQTPESPSASTTSFFGWRGNSSQAWQVSSLERLGSALTREQVFGVIRNLIAPLGQLHRSGWFHGGLRPSSIFLTGNADGGQNLHIAGYGELFMGGLQFLEAGHHLFYAAPEQLASGDFNEGRGQAWDVYAFGVIAFQLLTGHLPRLDHLFQHAKSNPDWLPSEPAITFGELSDLTTSLVEQLEVEGSVVWPTSPADSSESALRKVVQSCLDFVPSRRPRSLDEVAPVILEILGDASSPSRAKDAAPSPLKVASGPATANESTAPTTGEPEPQSGTTRPLDETARVHVGTSDSNVIEDVLGETAEPSRRKVRSASGEGFLIRLRQQPVLRWQLTAIVALIAILPLTFFSFFYYVDARKAKKAVVTEAADLQAKLTAKVNRQAAAFQRDIEREKERKEKLESVLHDLEGSQSNLMGQAKLARQILRQTQDNGDRFFRLVLENRDTDVPEFRAGRAEALAEGRKHYERLVEAYGDAPDFIVSTANAFFYLGQIYKEMGEFGKSLASFGEAERRYSALLEEDSTSSVEFVKNIAIAKNALGELSIRSGEYSAARHYFTESSRFWTEARSREPALGTVAALNIHENSLDIVECEFAMDRLDAAGDAAMSVGVSLTKMQESEPGNHRLIGALAKSFSLVGRFLETRSDLEGARQAYQQSSDLFASAVKLDAAVDAYQLGLGNSLARVGLLANDTGKLEGAAEVLERVIASNPYESIYLKTLADIYGALAANQRDGGKLKNAIALEERAISILKPIIESNPSVAPDVKHSYAQRLAHLAEMLGDSGKFDESRVPLKAAIAMLEEISKDEEGVTEFHRTLARTRGLAGFACLKTGDKGGAKELLQLAKSDWQSYAAANPDDDAAAQAVKWTSEQLENLQ